MCGIIGALACCTAFIPRSYFANQSLQATPVAEPPTIDPGPVGGPPSDAIVLFDGKDVSGWNNVKGAGAKWLVKDGVMIVLPRSGSIATKQEFGDVQLHLEWAPPAEIMGEGQGAATVASI